jgi:hypothetical protein
VSLLRGEGSDVNLGEGTTALGEGEAEDLLLGEGNFRRGTRGGKLLMDVLGEGEGVSTGDLVLGPFLLGVAS